MNSSAGLRILLTGATGLVGQGVVLACQSSAHVAATTGLVRRPGDVAAGVGEIVLSDFRRLAESGVALGGFDACFYCAGATPLGTNEARYRQVTLDTTVAVAHAFAAANPQGRFLYVSGAGADPASRFMPLRVKGETERVLSTLPIRVVLLRPGAVRPVAGTGTRHALLKPLYWAGSPLIRLAGAAAPSRVTSNLTLGEAMIALTRMDEPPLIAECGDINRIAADAAASTAQGC
ncbi:MAG TPA: oxidoreductase [Stenotrophomonas sp.]|nr:oxidoreductase [Stenotrophomonas sp.]